jgi:MYXO-CTERM domain-containing protein
MTRENRQCRHIVLGASLALAVLTPKVARGANAVDKLQEFPLDQVQITDTYQQTLFSKDMTYLITTLDSDRLLAGFKAVSQGNNPTNLYGGWEGTNIRGHSMGHWLSAMAHAYQQAMGSDTTLAGQIKTKLDDVISKLKTYQLSSGFLFASPISEFDAFEAGTGGWVPYYTMHKILSGLIDVYNFEQNADALAVASKLGDWIYSRSAGWSSSAKSKVLGNEYGGLNDALYELYKLTNNANHLTAAHVFDDTGLFTTIAGGTDNLSGKHANTTIPKFIGALNRYRTLGTGEASYLNAASGFFGTVLKSHTYVTGGNSQDEHFHNPGSLNQYRDNVNNETCNAYNMTKLTRDLFKVTGDVKYADFYERIHINEILSSINPETGMTTYFKAMGTGYFKVFGSTTNHFWCCTGTGMENFTRLGDSVYFHDAKDLWVTYYVSSKLAWKDRGLSLTQTTDLPLSNKVTFTITAAPTDAVSLKFRKPDWTSTCQMAITVNGQPVTPVEAGGFLSVSRVWQADDKVELAFPLLLQVSRLQDNQNAVAFTYGPMVLSAGLGTDSMTTTSHGVQVLKATKPTGLQDTIKVSSGTINDWLANIQTNLVQTPGKLEFNLKGTDSDGKLVFVPHYARYKDRYGIYWIMSGTAGGTAAANVTCPTLGGGGTGGASGTDAGAGGTGAGGATGGTGKGGAGGPGDGGATSGSGGAQGSGGRTGSTGAGGAQGTGGAAAGAGGSGNGGAAGAQGSGGRTTSSAGSGGTQPSGGSAAGGTSNPNGGSGHAGGAAGGSAGNATDSNTGCSCSLAGRASTNHWTIGLLMALGLVGWRRRRR